MRPQTWLAGRDLIPLPFESYIGVAMRIAWRNVFDVPTMRNNFSASKTELYLNDERWHDKLGWSLPQTSSAPYLTNGYCAFEAATFRYCPLCLAAGYHSYLFQCRELLCCPLHHVPLSDRCHSCNTKTALMSRLQDLFAKPYFCRHCQLPLAGAEPDLEVHLDFRQGHESIRRALEPYDAWWLDGMGARTLVVDLASSFTARRFRWCGRGKFIRSLTRAQSAPGPTPEYLELPPYRDVMVMLAWNQRAPDTPEFYDWEHKKWCVVNAG